MLLVAFVSPWGRRGRIRLDRRVSDVLSETEVVSRAV